MMIARGHCRSLIVAAAVASLLLAGRADAAGTKADEAREFLDKATAAFALNRYAVAAENYERSFELKPDAAVLYNAAQAYRLAGNKERALDLYQSYLRMYRTDKRAEIEKHIANLKQAIEKDRSVATSPPTTTAPVGGTPPPPTPGSTPGGSTIVATPGPAPAVAPPPAAPSPPPPGAQPTYAQPTYAQPAPVLVGQPSPPPEQGSVVSKPWFWAVVGGVLAAAVVTSLLLARPGPSDPRSTLTPVDGN